MLNLYIANENFWVVFPKNHISTFTLKKTVAENFCKKLFWKNSQHFYEKICDEVLS